MKRTPAWLVLAFVAGGLAHALWVQHTLPQSAPEVVEQVEAAVRRPTALSAAQRDREVARAETDASAQLRAMQQQLAATRKALDTERAASNARLAEAQRAGSVAAVLDELPRREDIAWRAGYAEGEAASRALLVNAGLHHAREVAELQHQVRVAGARADAATQLAMQMVAQRERRMGPGTRFGVALGSCTAGAGVAMGAWIWGDPGARDARGMVRQATVAGSGCLVAAAVDAAIAALE